MQLFRSWEMRKILILKNNFPVLLFEPQHEISDNLTFGQV